MRIFRTAAALALISVTASAQSWIPTAGDVERFFEKVHAHIARVQEQQAFEARARWVGVRSTKARSVLARVKTRAKKLDRRIEGWRDDIDGRRGLQRRLRDLANASRSVRRSTMRRNYASLIEAVRRKIAQRQEWIERAEKDLRKLSGERKAAEEILEEAARIRKRLAQ